MCMYMKARGVVCSDIDIHEMIFNDNSNPIVEEPAVRVTEGVNGTFAVHTEPYVCVSVGGRTQRSNQME